MTHSGYIDWHRNSKMGTDSGEGTTFVYAYWLVDFEQSQKDSGVTILKERGEHPDWFINSEHADDVLFSVLADDVHPSPNDAEVYEKHSMSRPLLAAICLGTAKATYRNVEGHYWWCSTDDLTRQGRRLIKELSMLYLRPPVLVTFLDLRPMKKTVPGAGRDQATVSRAPGRT